MPECISNVQHQTKCFNINCSFCHKKNHQFGSCVQLKVQFLIFIFHIFIHTYVCSVLVILWADFASYMLTTLMLNLISDQCVFPFDWVYRFVTFHSWYQWYFEINLNQQFTSAPETLTNNKIRGIEQIIFVTQLIGNCLCFVFCVCECECVRMDLWVPLIYSTGNDLHGKTMHSYMHFHEIRGILFTIYCQFRNDFSITRIESCIVKSNVVFKFIVMRHLNWSCLVSFCLVSPCFNQLGVSSIFR